MWSLHILVLRIVIEYSWSFYSVCSDQFGLVWCVVLDYLLLLKTGITYVDSGIMERDASTLLWLFRFICPFVSCTKIYEYPCRKLALYLILYNILSTYDYSYVYDTTSGEAAVASRNVVKDVMDQEIPRGLIAKSKFLDWSHGSSRDYDRKKIRLPTF